MVKPIQSWRGRLQASTCLEVDLLFFLVPVFEHFANLPQYDLIEIGVTSQVIGMEKFGNVVEGEFSNSLPLALKLFGLRVTDALRAFV
jgi:hypothetical protein